VRTYFVLGLPRSGLTWLSNFLTWRDSFCYHQLSYGCESLDHFDTCFRRTELPIVGNAESAMCLFYRQVADRFPNSKFLFIVRDYADVEEALKHHGYDVTALPDLGKAFSEACRDETLDSFSTSYDSLFRQTGMREIWEFLGLPEPFPWQRFELLREMHIQNVSQYWPNTLETRIKAGEHWLRFGKLMHSVQPQVPEQQRAI